MIFNCRDVLENYQLNQGSPGNSQHTVGWGPPLGGSAVTPADAWQSIRHFSDTLLLFWRVSLRSWNSKPALLFLFHNNVDRHIGSAANGNQSDLIVSECCLIWLELHIVKSARQYLVHRLILTFFANQNFVDWHHTECDSGHLAGYNSSSNIDRCKHPHFPSITWPPLFDPVTKFDGHDGPLVMKVF